MTIEVTTRASELADSISTLAEQLQRDLAREGSKQELFADLRQIRRSVSALDQELREGGPSTVGDAC